MRISRRKFLVSAAAAGALGGLGAFVASGGTQPGFVWRGSALGGEARVALYGADAEVAREALTAVANEIERLEEIFSLFRATSELSRLNRAGILKDPSRDLVDVVSASLGWRARTDGAFDPTVQPLWQAAASGAVISNGILTTAGTPIGIASDCLRLSPGCALTLNGIAQGRIADRVTETLISRGFSDVVVDAGELRLPGKFRRSVGIPAAKAAVTVADIAVATSEPKSLVFDRQSWRHHLIDPRTGESPHHWQSISVFAPTAESADALSTAFAVLPYSAVADLAKSIGDIAVVGRDGRGRIRRFGELTLLGTERLS
jgi:FAD:protein FMN transferase